VRTGNTFTSFVSADGNSWTQIDSQTVTLPTNAYVGFAVTSHSTSTGHTGNFTNWVLRAP
jgi:hypothetical protein